MKLSDAFPSNFLKAEDLQGKSVVVVINEIEFDTIGKDSKEGKKLILSFKGKEKKMVCNKTNAKTLEKLYGDDTDDWIGRPIKLVSREVEFQGDVVWALRVSLEKPSLSTPSPANAPEPEPEPVDGDEPPF
jgi:hypothetical protein